MRSARAAIVIVWLVALVIALVAVPRPQEIVFAARDPLPEQIAVAESRFKLQSELFRRAHGRALATAALSQPRGGGDLTVIRPASVPPPFETWVRTRVRRSLAPVPARDTSIRLIAVLAADTGAMLDGTPVYNRGGYGWSADIFPPGSVANDACITVVRAHRLSLLRGGDYAERVFSGDVLGACWWYAVYGTPGRGVAAWLDSTDYAPIIVRGRSNWFLNYDSPWANSARPSALDLESRFDVGRCTVGASPCTPLLLAAPDVRAADAEHAFTATVRTPGWASLRRPNAIYSNILAATLLARLEGQLGHAAFAEFWKSDAPVPNAIAAAVGRPAEEWTREQIRNVAGEYRSSPFPYLQLVLLPLIAAAALIAAGVHGVRRKSGFA